jgi:hypothetical protein
VLVYPPGVYTITVYKTDVLPLGSFTRTVLPYSLCGWPSTCTNDSCGEGYCSSGSCICPQQRWGGNCSRGCPAVVRVLEEIAGTISSDEGALYMNQSRSTMLANCTWIIRPRRSEGGSRVRYYVQLSFDFINIGFNDVLYIYSGWPANTSNLVSSFTYTSDVSSAGRVIFAPEVALVFALGFGTGSYGFRVHYEVQSEPGQCKCHPFLD